MKKALSLAAAGAALLLAAGAATSASALTFFTGNVSVTGAYTNPQNNGGLVIDINNSIPNFGPIGLSVGDSTLFPVELFGIYAGEPINVPGGGSDGDNTPKSIHVNFTFTNPNPPGSGPDGTVDGTTVGVDGVFLPDYGSVTWTDTSKIDFAGVGELTISLLPTTFGTGIGNEGFVYANFSLAALPTTTGGGVPEPASWALMIGGFGMAGAALRRRRAVAATA